MSGKVYVLKQDVPLGVRLFDDWNPFTIPCKIGKTKNKVAGRRSHAATGSPYPVLIHAEYRVRNHHRAERLLHWLFKGAKVQEVGRNEWYHLAPWDLWVIDIVARLL